MYGAGWDAPEDSRRAGNVAPVRLLRQPVQECPCKLQQRRGGGAAVVVRAHNLEGVGAGSKSHQS